MGNENDGIAGPKEWVRFESEINDIGLMRPMFSGDVLMVDGGDVCGVGCGVRGCGDSSSERVRECCCVCVVGCVLYVREVLRPKAKKTRAMAVGRGWGG